MTKSTSFTGTIIFFSFMLCSCAAHDEKFIPEKFEIARTSVKLPFEVKELIAFEGGYVCNFENFNDQIKHPIGYDKGFKVLVDTTDIQIIGAFVSKDFLYHIFSDAKNTYLGYFDHQKPFVLDTIVQEPSRYGYVRDLQNNPNLFVMKSSHFNGVIVRNKHKIRLIKFEHTS